MTKENELTEHNLIQFLTGWGINDANGLGKAIMEHFDFPEPLDEKEVIKTI